MFPVDGKTTSLILLMNETRTMSLEDFLLPSGRTEGNNSPRSRIHTEPPSRQFGNASFKQESSR